MVDGKAWSLACQIRHGHVPHDISMDVGPRGVAPNADSDLYLVPSSTRPIIRQSYLGRALHSKNSICLQ